MSYLFSVRDSRPPKSDIASCKLLGLSTTDTQNRLEIATHTHIYIEDGNYFLGFECGWLVGWFTVRMVGQKGRPERITCVVAAVSV